MPRMGTITSFARDNGSGRAFGRCGGIGGTFISTERGLRHHGRPRTFVILFHPRGSLSAPAAGPRRRCRRASTATPISGRHQTNCDYIEWDPRVGITSRGAVVGGLRLVTTVAIRLGARPSVRVAKKRAVDHFSRDARGVRRHLEPRRRLSTTRQHHRGAAPFHMERARHRSSHHSFRALSGGGGTWRSDVARHSV